MQVNVLKKKRGKKILLSSSSTAEVTYRCCRLVDQEAVDLEILDTASEVHLWGYCHVAPKPVVKPYYSIFSTHKNEFQNVVDEKPRRLSNSCEFVILSKMFVLLDFHWCLVF